MNSEKRNFSAVTLLWLMAQLVTLTGVLVLLLHAPAAAALQDLMGFFPGHAIVPARQILVSVALSLLLVRMALTSLVLLPRRIDPPEAIVVGVWIGIIQFTIGLSALGNGSPPGAGAAAGAVLFVLGSFINSWSEYQRKRFKAKPENGGRLYTGGLFSVSMHINYFGDMIWATGLALMTGSLISAAIPVIMTAMFVWIHIPRLDAYLAEKYGREFEDYASRTKKLIPWMY